MPFTNPTIFKLPNLLDVRRAAKGSIMYFDDPKGNATTAAELFSAGKFIMSNNLMLSSSATTRITASDTFEVNGGDAYFHNDVFISGSLTINGPTTTISSTNLLVEDPFVILGEGSTTQGQLGGLIILSGSSVTDQSLVIGNVESDTWGVGRIDAVNGTIQNFSGINFVSFKAGDLITTTGVISGSNDKAIEFDADGNITTLTTTAPVQHNVLAYDGSKWVPSASLESGGVDSAAVAAMFTGGNHTSISFTYDSTNEVVDADVSIDNAMTITYTPYTIKSEITLSADETKLRTNSSSYVAGNRIEFDTLTGDTRFSNLGANPGRFTIPTGVTKIKLTARISQGSTGNPTDIVYLGIWKNGTSRIAYEAMADNYLQDRGLGFSTGIIDVAESDYFELLMGDYHQLNDATTTSTISSSVDTFLELEVVEGSILNTTVNSTISELILQNGIISGSNDKAIEFDADGNITTLTTADPASDDVLKWDGNKWIASKTLPWLDTLDDLLPITYTTGATASDILDLVSNKYYVYNDQRNWPNSGKIRLPNSTNSSNGDTIVVKNIRPDGLTGGSALRIQGNTGVTVSMPNGGTYSGNTSDPRLPGQSTATFKYLNTVWYVTFSNGLPMDSENFSNNDLISYNSTNQTLESKAYSNFYHSVDKPLRFDYVSLTDMDNNYLTNKPQIAVLTTNAPSGTGTKFFTTRVPDPGGNSSPTPVNGTKYILYNARTQTSGGNTQTIRGYNNNQNIFRDGFTEQLTDAIYLESLEYIELLYINGIYHVSRPVNFPFELGHSNWVDGEFAAYDSTTKKFVSKSGDPTYNSKNSNFTAAIDNYYSVTTNVNLIVTIPQATASLIGKRIEVKFKSGSGSVTLTPHEGDTIEGSNEFILSVSSTTGNLGQGAILVCDGSGNWEVM